MMKKRWSIFLTANLLSALVSPLMVHAVAPTTESEEILKNISQSSQTYAKSSIEQSDMIKQTIKNIQETQDMKKETDEAVHVDNETTDTTNMTLSEDSKQEKDNDVYTDSESQSTQQTDVNKVSARSTRAATTTGKWNQVSWEFDESTGALTFTGSGRLGKWNSSPWNQGDIEGNEVTNIIFEKNVIAPSDSSYLFSGIVSGENNLSNLVTIKGLDKIDVSNVTKMPYMFQHLIKIQKLDLSSWDVSEVDDMEGMFESSFLESPDYVKELNISSFNITDSHPSNIQRMFYSTHFNKITVGKNFDLYGELGFYDFPLGDWYNSSGKNVGLSSGSSERNPFLSYLARGNPGTYTTYPPDNPPKPPEEVLKWGTVPYRFDESTGELTFTDSGTFSGATNSPWNRSDGKGISATSVKKIVFTKQVNAPSDSKDLFSSSGTGKDYLSNVASIEHLDYLNTSNVTNMDSFFSGLSSIKTLDLSKFDTRNVTTMHGMFYINKSISSLNLNYSSFDTSKVSKMSDMFNGMSTLTNLDISNFKTTKVQDFSGIFKDVSSLTDLSLSQFDTFNATNMSKMFNGMKNLKTLNVSNFNTSKVTDMNNMFNGVSSLTDLSVKNFDTKNVTNMTSLFQGAKSLKSIDVSSFNTSKVISMKEMFRGMTGISSLNLGNFNFTSVTDKKDMFLDNTLKEITLPATFSDTTNSTNLNNVPTTDGYSGNWVNINDKSKKLGQTLEFLKNTSGKAGTYIWGNTIDDFLKWGDVPYEFDESSGVLTFTDSGTFDEADKSPWNRSDGKGIDATKIKKIVFTKSVKAPPYSKDLFSRFSSKKPYLSNVTSIEHLDYLNTSSVTSMDSFFSGLSSIKSLDLSNFDTRKVTDMNGMFYQNKSIEFLNLDYMLFDTSNVTKMSDMFRGMSSLSKLDITKFNTSKVTTFSDMFKDLSSMTSLDVSSFNTSSSNNMYEMFAGMTGLIALDLSNFDFNKVNEKSAMFSGAPIKEITLPKTFSDSKNTTKLNNVSTEDGYNGQWQNSEGKLFGQTDKFLQNYNGVTDAGTYTWGQYLKWGDVPYEFNEDSGVLTFYKNGDNVLGNYTNSPWNRSHNKIEATKIKEIVFTEPVSTLSNSFALFSSNSNNPSTKLQNVTKIVGIEKIDTSKTTNMTQMFNGMSGIKELDLSHFNTKNTINMNAMFYGMTGLQSLDVSSFDTINVTNMSNTFANLRNLIKLDISNFNTKNVTNMSQMFNNDANMTNLILDKQLFNTSKVTNMSFMFNNMSSLTNLDVSGFDTSHVTNMQSMFRNMSSVDMIDVSSFNTSIVTNMESMFEGMKDISSLNIGNFDFSKVLSKANMFLNTPIRELTIPNTFSDVDDTTRLNEVSTTDGYNGNWVSINDKSKKLGQTLEFLKNYAGKAGTYIWGTTIDDMLKWGDVPYIFDEETGTLTFYKNGNNVLGTYHNSPWNRNDDNRINAQKITDIVFTEPVSAPEDSSYLFSAEPSQPQLENLVNIEGLNKLNTSKVTTMYAMFYALRNIDGLDVSSFDTKNVKNMGFMFGHNFNAKALDVSNFDVTNVIDMDNMFANMSSLMSLKLPNTEAKKVVDYSSMFLGVSSLKTLDLSLINTDNAKNMNSMFADMNSLESIDVSRFNTSKVTDMNAMFKGMRSVSKIDVSNFDTSEVTNMNSMFKGMTGISSLNLGSFDFSKVTSKKDMFAEDTLKEITLPTTFSDPSNVTNLNSVPTDNGYNGQWQNSEGKRFGQTDKFLQNYNGITDAGTYTWSQYLKWGDVPYEFNESTGILTFYKNGDNVLGPFNVSPWNRPDTDRINASKIKEIIFTEPTKTPVDSTLLFSSNSTKLTNVMNITGIEKLDTSNTVNMSRMFIEMSNIKELDLSHFVTTNVNNMDAMFYKLENIEKLNVSSFDTSKVTDMSSMFSELRKLPVLDISNFDTKNVLTMREMFNNDENMSELIFDKTKFDTSNVTSLFYTFNNMYKLKELDVSNFNTSKVTNMSATFREMRAIEKLDVSNFNTSNVTSMSSMFSGISGLSAIDVTKFDTTKVRNMSQMFSRMPGISSLNLESFDFTNVSNKNGMFSGDEIKEITLPKTFSDINNNTTNLNNVPINDTYNGNWVNIEDKNTLLGQTVDFLKNTAGKAGTYIWGRQASLRLVKVPDLYDFGANNAIRDVTQILSPKIEENKDVEISDDREQKTPWSLGVQASNLENDKSADLQQARYQFNIATTGTNNLPINHIDFSDKRVLLPADGSTQILYSVSDSSQNPMSYNTWISDMKLVIDQNTGKSNEQYKGTITWSLDLTPKD